MTNYKEILRLHSLGINNTRIAESCGWVRSTVIAASRSFYSVRYLRLPDLLVELPVAQPNGAY